MKATLFLTLPVFLILIPTLDAVLDTPASGTYGELKCWHRITVAFEGPEAAESGTTNPFLDYRLDVTFTHVASGVDYVVPGYFAADGNAGESGATRGNIWRAHFAPGHTGVWHYKGRFRTGPDVAVSDAELPGSPALLNGNADGVVTGTFLVADSDKAAPDNRGRGRLEYVGKHYLRFAGSGEYFLKQGADAPENLLAYEDFDGDFKTDGHYNKGTFESEDQSIKSYAPHAGDWKDGDPSWKGGRGTELIGAINYLASEGLNAISFLTMNIEGDDMNVFPYTSYDERLRLDVSRLDQWEVVFTHADKLGFHLHFKTQETENDLLLDGGELGRERKLYYRELVARFSHHLALNWNLGEENDIFEELEDPGQTRIKAYASRFRKTSVPFWKMSSQDAIVRDPEGNPAGAYCFAQPGKVYVVYLPHGGMHSIDLSGQCGVFALRWFNPRTGGGLQVGSAETAAGGCVASLGAPPQDAGRDWVVLLTRQDP